MVPGNLVTQTALRCRRGFSLIELVLLIAVIGIVATLGIQRIGNSIALNELDAAARTMEADLRWVQQLTVNQHAGHAPVFKVRTSSPYGYYVTLDTVSIKRMNFPSGMTVGPFSAAAYADGLTFNNDGNLTVPSSVTLMNSAGARTIYLDVAGRIRMQ